MVKTKKAVFLTLILVLGVGTAHSQVRIGQIEKPVAGTVLDLRSTPSGGYVGGLLLPNVKITKINTIPDNFIGRSEIVPAKLAGLLVYNSLESNEVQKGIYVWNGTKWMKIN
ncbi:MAG: hypothetical protein LBR97_07000 [Dysgonamonadaceae bacterium]|nr:hypothetical protein [Dysgonamonadaceae bacterium]